MSESQRPPESISRQEIYENTPQAGYSGERSERQELVEQWTVLSGLLSDSDVIRARFAIPSERKRAMRDLASLVENLPQDAVPKGWQEQDAEQVLEIVQRYIRSATDQTEEVIASLSSFEHKSDESE